MSRGPVVNVTVTADAADASRTFKTIGDDAKDMGVKVDRAGTDVKGGIDKLTEGADGGERKLRGMNDTIAGTQGLMQGLASGDIVGVIGGLTDLAGGIADFAGPALAKLASSLGLTTTATVVQTEAQVASNTAMSLNPIGIVVIALVALVAAFYLAWKNSETFREIVTGAFNTVKDVVVGVYEWVRDNWPLLLAILTGPIGIAVYEIIKHWDDIKGAFTGVKDWISEKVDDIVGFITGLPGRLGQVVTDLLAKGKEFGGALIDGVKQGLSGLASAVGGLADVGLDFAKQVGNAVIRFINDNVIGRFNSAVKIDFKFHGVGVTLDPPDVPPLPYLGAGGIVRARQGGVLALLAEAGQDEAVIPLGPGGGFLGGGGNVYQYFPAGVDPRQVTEAQRRWRRRNGGAA